MERPSKRIKIADPQVRNPRDSGSRRTEGLFTSEMGMRSDESDKQMLPTRTISLSDFQRQNVFGNYQHAPRPVLPRRNAGIYMLPRAPDATVTANVVQVNVNDGTATSMITEVPVASTGAVVSLTDVGLLTTAVSVSIPGASNSTTVTGSSTNPLGGTTTTRSTLTSSTSIDSSTITSFTSSSSTISQPLSQTNNGTITAPTSSSDNTVTVTATSTFEVSVINGTIVATQPTFGGVLTTTTGEESTRPSTTTASRTYTFGQLPSSTDSSSHSFTTSFTSSYFASSVSSPTDGTGAGATNFPSTTSDAAATTSSSSSTSSGGGGGSSNGLTPTQQQVVGGVVGGVAGIAVALTIVLFVLRWYRGRLKSRGRLPEQIAAREMAGGGPGEAYPMSQRSSMTPLAAAMAHFPRRLRPHSNQTIGTTGTGNTEASVPESERGFQRIAGRKLAPVIGSGGDPYGGNYGAFEKDAGVGPSDLPDRGLSGASFYQDNRGFYGGKGTQTPPIPSSPTTATAAARTGTTSAAPGTASSTRDFAAPRASSMLNSSQTSLASPSRPEGYAVMRPSPARTPVTLSPAASSIRLPIQQPPTMDPNAPPLPMPLSRDGVGRSLASQDGSRVSRSSGRSAGRFVENL